MSGLVLGFCVGLVMVAHGLKRSEESRYRIKS